MFNEFFTLALEQEWHRAFKKECHARNYRSAKAEKLYCDFGTMYLMGGEL